MLPSQKFYEFMTNTYSHTQTVYVYECGCWSLAEPRKPKPKKRWMANICGLTDWLADFLWPTTTGFRWMHRGKRFMWVGRLLCKIYAYFCFTIININRRAQKKKYSHMIRLKFWTSSNTLAEEREKENAGQPYPKKLWLEVGFNGRPTNRGLFITNGTLDVNWLLTIISGGHN